MNSCIGEGCYQIPPSFRIRARGKGTRIALAALWESLGKLCGGPSESSGNCEADPAHETAHDMRMNRA